MLEKIFYEEDIARYSLDWLDQEIVQGQFPFIISGMLLEGEREKGK